MIHRGYAPRAAHGCLAHPSFGVACAPLCMHSSGLPQAASFGASAHLRFGVWAAPPPGAGAGPLGRASPAKLPQTASRSTIRTLRNGRPCQHRRSDPTSTRVGDRKADSLPCSSPSPAALRHPQSLVGVGVHDRFFPRRRGRTLETGVVGVWGRRGDVCVAFSPRGITVTLCLVARVLRGLHRGASQTGGKTAPQGRHVKFNLEAGRQRSEESISHSEWEQAKLRGVAGAAALSVC